MLPAAGHAYSSHHVPRRTGNRHVADYYVPFDTFETSDGWVSIVCATDDHWAKLTQAMKRADLAANESLRHLHGRIEEIDEVTQWIGDWTRHKTREDVSALCEKLRIPAAPLRDQRRQDQPKTEETGLATFPWQHDAHSSRSDGTWRDRRRDQLDRTR